MRIATAVKYITMFFKEHDIAWVSYENTDITLFGARTQYMIFKTYEHGEWFFYYRYQTKKQVEERCAFLLKSKMSKDIIKVSDMYHPNI